MNSRGTRFPSFSVTRTSEVDSRYIRRDSRVRSHSPNQRMPAASVFYERAASIHGCEEIEVARLLARPPAPRRDSQNRSKSERQLAGAGPI